MILICPLQRGHSKGSIWKMRFMQVAQRTDERAILKIADSLRIPRAQAPPKIGLSPPQEFYDDIPPDDFSA
jgi:hypothetical protein